MSAFRYSQPHEPHFFTTGASGFKSAESTPATTNTNSRSSSLSSSVNSLFIGFGGGSSNNNNTASSDNCLDTMTQKIDETIFRVLKLRGGGGGTASSSAASSSASSMNPMSEALLADQATQMLVKYFVPMPRDITLRIEALVREGNLARVDNGAIVLRYAPSS